MTIEEEVFKKAKVNIQKLQDYGFQKKDDKYVFEKMFLNNKFNAIITFSNEHIIGNIIDLEFNEEYTNIRTQMHGEFVSKVRKEYKDILLDIKDKCFDNYYYISNQANRINAYIKKQYNDNPEFLWTKFPGFGVYRNKTNNKWYAIIMNIDLSKLEAGNGEVEIINVKTGKKTNDCLKEKGIYKAYHMKKAEWVSIVLNDTLSDDQITKIIDLSYDLINNPKGVK